MSEEAYDNESFSPFYPLLVLLVGLILWLGYQDFEANLQRSALSAQLQAAVPSLTQAKNIQDRYVALMKDLIETATTGKNEKAAAIVKEAQAAGLLRVQQPAPGEAGASAGAPAPADGTTAPAPAPAKP